MKNTKTKFILMLFAISVSFTTKAQWSVVNVPHYDSSFLYILEAPNSNTLWAEPINMNYASNNYYVRTTDGGATWKFDSIAIIKNAVISGMSALDANTCYISMYNTDGTKGYILKTTDGGVNWNVSDTNSKFSLATADDIYFWNANEGVAIGDPAGPGNLFLQVYKTNDGGGTWTRIDSNSIAKCIFNEYGFNNSHITIGNHIWFVTGVFDDAWDFICYRFWSSTDKGLHWTASAIRDSATSIRCNFPINIAYGKNTMFVDDMHGFVCSGNDTLFYTNNNGASWHFRTTYTGTIFPECLANVPGTTTLISASDGIYTKPGSSYSNDFGKTWKVIDSGATALHGHMKFFNDKLGWSSQLVYSKSVAGGAYKWLSNYPVGLTTNIQSEVGVSIFPNPSAETFFVRVLKAGESKINVMITDITGKIVKDITDENPGQFFMQSIDIRGMVPGIYFVNIIVGEGKYSQKLIIE